MSNIEKIVPGSNNQKLLTMSALVNLYKIIRLLIIAICISYLVGGLWFALIRVLPIHQIDNNAVTFITMYNLNINNSNSMQR